LDEKGNKIKILIKASSFHNKATLESSVESLIKTLEKEGINAVVS